LLIQLGALARWLLESEYPRCAGNPAAVGEDAMDGTIYCLVDARGKVYVKDFAESHADVAAHFALNERDCQTYRFDLADRQLLTDRATPASANAAQTYLNQRVGTPERLMQFAEDGHVSKGVLANLLDVEARQPYLEACAAIEQKYTKECAAKKDPCLESGCSIDQAAGEVCLQPLLNAGVEYHKACAAEWTKLFRRPQNRVDAWKN
jgi:hypothetical protein